MKKYTDDEKKERKKIQQNRHQNRQQQFFDDMKRELGFKINPLKPQNSYMERKRQELITRHFKMYGWFKDFIVEDKKRLQIDYDEVEIEKDIEDFYEKNNDEYEH